MRKPAGSPARAGIDRMRRRAGLSSSGFPRTRGDRPLEDLSQEDAETVPPHARG